MTNNLTICIIAVTFFVLLFLTVSLIAVLYYIKENTNDDVETLLRKVDFGLQENHKRTGNLYDTANEIREAIKLVEQHIEESKEQS